MLFVVVPLFVPFAAKRVNACAWLSDPCEATYHLGMPDAHVHSMCQSQITHMKNKDEWVWSCVVRAMCMKHSLHYSVDTAQHT